MKHEPGLGVFGFSCFYLLVSCGFHTFNPVFHIGFMLLFPICLVISKGFIFSSFLFIIKYKKRKKEK